MCLYKREYFTCCGDSGDNHCIEDTLLRSCPYPETCKPEYLERWINDCCRSHPFHAGDESDDDEDDVYQDEVIDDKEGEDVAAGGDEMVVDRRGSAPGSSAPDVYIIPGIPLSQGRRLVRRNEEAHAGFDTSFFDNAMGPAPPADTEMGMGLGIQPVFNAHTFSFPAENQDAQPKFANFTAVPSFTDIHGVNYTQNLQMFEQPAFGPGFQPQNETQTQSQYNVNSYVHDVLSGEFGLPGFPADTTGTAEVISSVNIDNGPTLSDITIDMETLQEFNNIVNPLRATTSVQQQPLAPPTTPVPMPMPAESSHTSPPVQSIEPAPTTPAEANTDTHEPKSATAQVQANTTTSNIALNTPSPYSIVSDRPTPRPMSQSATPTPGREAGQGGEKRADDDEEEEGEEGEEEGGQRPRKRRRKGARLVVRKYAWKRRGGNGMEG